MMNIHPAFCCTEPGPGLPLAIGVPGPGCGADPDRIIELASLDGPRITERVREMNNFTLRIFPLKRDEDARLLASAGVYPLDRSYRESILLMRNDPEWRGEDPLQLHSRRYLDRSPAQFATDIERAVAMCGVPRGALETLEHNWRTKEILDGVDQRAFVVLAYPVFEMLLSWGYVRHDLVP